MAYKAEDIEVKSLSVLNEKMDAVLSAAQDFRDVLMGNRVELSFNSMGGSEIQNRVVYRNQSYGILPEPYKDGYDFAGWYLNMTSNNDVYFYSGQIKNMDVVQIPTPTATLYAKWENAQIVFELDAGGGSVEPDVISVRYLDYFGEAFQGVGRPTGLPIPKHLFNIFEYWSSDPPQGNNRGTNRIEAGTTNVYISRRKLYANWRNTAFYIYYDVDGGSNGHLFEPQLADNGKYNTLSSLEAAKEITSRDGFVLLGFTDVRGSLEPKTEIFIDNHSVTVYAIWERERYRLTYLNDNGKPLKITDEDGKENPQSVLLDWIDYLNFVDDFKFKDKMGTYFARWTTPPANQIGHNPWVANLMPEDGDILWNYNMGSVGSSVPKGETTLIPIGIEQVPNSVLVEVGVCYNPLSDESLVLRHGDSLSAYQYGVRNQNGTYDTRNVFQLSAKISSTINPKARPITIGPLSGEQIRLYPRQAKYMKPDIQGELKDNSFVAVSFAYNTKMEGVKIPVTVEKSLTRIELIEPPTKTTYTNGEPVDVTGLRLSVIYSDGVESEEIYFDTNVLEKGIVSCSMNEHEPGQTTVCRKFPALNISATYGDITRVLPKIAFTVNLSSMPTLIWDATSENKLVLTNSSGNKTTVFTGKVGDSDVTFDGAYEPTGEAVCVNEYNQITNLKVFAKYDQEDASLCEDEWDRLVRVTDYYFTPREISENGMRTWDYVSSGNNYTARLYDLSVYWRSNNDVVSVKVPVSVFNHFGIGSLSLDNDSMTVDDVNWNALHISSNWNNVKLQNISYQKVTNFVSYGRLIERGIIVRIPISDEISNAGWTDPTNDPIFGAWRLKGEYNRPGLGTVDMRLSDCSITPSLIDFATSRVTASYDFGSVAVDIRPTLQGSCYCGFIEVIPSIVRSRDTQHPPVFLPQTFTPDDAGLPEEDESFYSNYVGTKYLRYYVVERGRVDDSPITNLDDRIYKAVTKRSEGDAESIVMSDFKSLIPVVNLDGFRVSVYYTNPNTVTEWNSPITAKDCRGISSFVSRVDIAPVQYTYLSPGTSEVPPNPDTLVYVQALDINGYPISGQASPLSNRSVGFGVEGYEEDRCLLNYSVGGLHMLSAMRYVGYYQTRLLYFNIKNPLNLRHAKAVEWWNLPEHINYLDHPLSTALRDRNNNLVPICCYHEWIIQPGTRNIARTNWPYFIGEPHSDSSANPTMNMGTSPMFDIDFYMAEIGRKCFISCVSLQYGFLFDDTYVIDTRESKSPTLTNRKRVYALPCSVRKIGYAAFAHCHLMSALIIQNGIDTFETYDYRDYNQSPFIYTLDENLSGDMDRVDGGANPNPKRRTHISSYREGLTIHRLSSIEPRAFYNCQNLTDIDGAIFGRWISSINTPITNTTISTDFLAQGNRFLNTIDEEVFANCIRIQGIRLSEISYISSMAFYNCNSLRTIIWPERIGWLNNFSYSYQNPNLNYKYVQEKPTHIIGTFEKMTRDSEFGITAGSSEFPLSNYNFRNLIATYIINDRAHVLTNRKKAPISALGFYVRNDWRFYFAFNSGNSNAKGSMATIWGFRGYDWITLPNNAFTYSGHTFKGWKYGPNSLPWIRIKQANGSIRTVGANEIIPNGATLGVAAGNEEQTFTLSAQW